MSEEQENPKRPGRRGPRGGWLAPAFDKATASAAGRRGGIKSGEVRRAKRAAKEREEAADRHFRRIARLGGREDSLEPAAPSWTPAPPSRKIMIVGCDGTRPAEPDVQPVFCHPWADESAEEMAEDYRGRGYEVHVCR